MKYTKEELNEYDIYSLRDLGRSMGVKAPTSLKKADLIENILNIQKGKIKPYKTKRGRPARPKKELSLEEIKIIIKDIIERNEERIKKELREGTELLLEELRNYDPKDQTKK